MNRKLRLKKLILAERMKIRLNKLIKFGKSLILQRLRKRLSGICIPVETYLLSQTESKSHQIMTEVTFLSALSQAPQKSGSAKRFSTK